MIHSTSSSASSTDLDAIQNFDLESMNLLFGLIREIQTQNMRATKKISTTMEDLDYRGFLGSELERQFGKNGVECLARSNKNSGLFSSINHMLHANGGVLTSQNMVYIKLHADERYYSALPFIENNLTVFQNIAISHQEDLSSWEEEKDDFDYTQSVLSSLAKNPVYHLTTLDQNNLLDDLKVLGGDNVIDQLKFFCSINQVKHDISDLDLEGLDRNFVCAEHDVPLSSMLVMQSLSEEYSESTVSESRQFAFSSEEIEPLNSSFDGYRIFQPRAPLSVNIVNNPVSDENTTLIFSPRGNNQKATESTSYLKEFENIKLSENKKAERKAGFYSTASDRICFSDYIDASSSEKAEKNVGFYATDSQRICFSDYMDAHSSESVESASTSATTPRKI